jgi:DNA-binding NarL/FixJ family response regulator
VRRTRILIADHHEVVRVGLRGILEADPNWEVVAECADGMEAVRRAAETEPDIVIVADTLPLLNGIEVTRQIRSRFPKTEVLVFTMHETESHVQNLLQAGARGYVLKSDAKQHLIAAIESLAERKSFFSPKVSEERIRAFVRSDREGTILTNRERDVVRLVADGQSNKEIARIFNTSPKTVEFQRAAVMRKLDLASSASLVRYAVRNGLVEA